MRLTLPASRGMLAAVAAVALAAAGGTVVAVTQLTGGSAGADAAVATPGDAPSVTLAGLRHGHVPWNKRLRLAASNGTIMSIRAVGKGGAPVEGTLAPNASRWTSLSKLVPLTRYRVEVRLAGSDDPITRTIKF